MPAPAPPIPADEPRRLAALRAIEILDEPSEPAYDDLVALTARLLRAPTAIINLVDGHRQFSLAGINVPHPRSIPRDISFCAHTVAANDVTVVADATRDPRFAANEFVRDGMRYYWGAPLAGDDGLPIGSLCVAGDEPREPDLQDLETLRVLAAAVSAHLALRRREVAGRREAEDLARLASVTRALARATELDDASLDVCLASQGMTGADGSIVWRVAADGLLESCASVGASVAGIRLDRDGSELEAVLADRVGARTVVRQPIELGHRRVGLLCAWWLDEAQPLDERTATLVAMLADEAAVALERSAAFAALRP
jgi:hypothetical protein